MLEPTITDCLDEIKRELALRRVVYERLIDGGKLKQSDARWQFACLVKAQRYLVALSNCGLASRCTADVRPVLEDTDQHAPGGSAPVEENNEPTGEAA